MIIISPAESHKIALRLSCYFNQKGRIYISAASDKLHEVNSGFKLLADELALKLRETGFEPGMTLEDANVFSAYTASAPMVTESRLDSDCRYHFDSDLRLDPALARQTVSLKNFSFSVQKYWIRLQNREPKMTVDDFCAEIMIQRSYFYKLLRAERQPSRNLAILICLALRLDIKEAQDLLMNLGEQLNLQVKRDYILIFGLENNLTIDQVEALLMQFSSKLLLNRL